MLPRALSSAVLHQFWLSWVFRVFRVSIHGFLALCYLPAFHKSHKVPMDQELRETSISTWEIHFTNPVLKIHLLKLALITAKFRKIDETNQAQGTHAEVLFDADANSTGAS